ncbi:MULTISPECIES: CHAD domain-containing protein [unclassified Pseudomonas]|uniref:CHAD domain-containing protein n=1 Tax=unclassified Pseudomonas TaxID=196821 RepID=UPI002E803A80|nr:MULTISPECIES: CHAD domain-containing protein [unclassified Pseudomonas]
MSFIDRYIQEILRLEVALFHSRARLEHQTDPEALHDLRIAIRRIRSLLMPLKNLQGMNGLREASADLGRLTTPARDLEVMVGELDKQGFSHAATERRVRLKAVHKVIARHQTLNQFFEELDQWPSIFRASTLGNDSTVLKKIIEKSLTKQIDRLHLALDDDQYDRHELRILVKRTRYLTEAFSDLSPLSKQAAKSLKAVQSALGSWHDHFQWRLTAQRERDLIPLVLRWEEASTEKLIQAEYEMKKLRALLPKIVDKKKAAAWEARQRKVSAEQ